MSQIEKYTEQARNTVSETVEDFRVTATLDGGTIVDVPFVYQIAEPGFRPYRAGKAAPEELREQFATVIGQADERGVALGLESRDSVRKLLFQLGLGVDCSNFAYRAMGRLHERIGLSHYDSTVFWPVKKINKFNQTLPTWKPKDADKNERPLKCAEAATLRGTGLVSVEWIADVFGKDPEFITGSSQMCSDASSVKVGAQDLIPGDIVSFQSATSGDVSHLGVIEGIRVEKTRTHVDFWHSWHTRDYDSGIRADFVVIDQNGSWHFSHEGLNDPARYQAYDFRRPTAVARHVAGLTGVL